MRTLLQAALAVDPLTFKHETAASGADALHPGDEVVLAGGPYRGTPGVFLRLKGDANWADVTERDGNVRSHPVEWLAHSGSMASGVGNASIVRSGAVS